MSRDESNNGGGEAAGGARIPMLRPDGSTPYAVWRPLIVTHMMRVGIDDRHYSRPIIGWEAAVAAATVAADDDEAESLRFVLSGGVVKDEPATSSGTPARAKDPSKALTEAAQQVAAAHRKKVAMMVAQTKRAYAILHAAIPDDVRALIGGVPHGYAFGLWSLLEARYQGKTDDNLATVWMRFTGCSQEVGEPFDAYAARVEKDAELLKAAKQEPPSGLRKVQLLYRLQPMYAVPRLALETTGKLTDTDAIDWTYVKVVMANHEREHAREHGANEGSSYAMAAMRPSSSAQHKQASYSKASSSSSGSNAGDDSRFAHIQCFNCNEFGHFARKCTKEQKPRHGGQSQPGAEGRVHTQRGGGGGGRGGNKARSSNDDASSYDSANAAECVFALMGSNRFTVLTNDDDDKYECDEPQWWDDDAAPVHRVFAATDATPRVLTRIKKANGKPIVRVGPKPNVDAKKERVDADAKLKRAAKLKAAIVAENKADAELRRELIERAKNRGANPIDKALKERAWGVDSMASLSVTGNRSLLTNVRRCPPVMIKVADGTMLSVTHKGDTLLTLKAIGANRNVSVTIHDVYWHPSFDVNLLSWGVLRVNGWHFNSGEVGTRVTTPKGTAVAATTAGNLTILETAMKPERVYAAQRLKVGRIVCATTADVVRLHERLGHVGLDRLLKLCRAGRTDGVGSIDGLDKVTLDDAKKQIGECVACLKGKMTRPEFGSRGLDKGNHPGDVLHVDTAYIKLPPDATGQKQVRHWLIGTDPYSEGRMTASAVTKDEIASKLIAMMTRLASTTGSRLRLLYCDNGSELVNRTVRDYCVEHGTQLVTPPANTPELRGAAERAVRSFKDGARTMLLHCGAHQPLTWEYAASFTAYLWNRTRIAKATGVTPIEALSGRTPSVLHVGVFGCDAWVHQGKSTSTSRNTFDAKALPGIYLGHDDNQHGAIVRLLASGKVIRTRDVELREDSFVHMTALRTGRIAEAANAQYRVTPRPAVTYDAGGATTTSRASHPSARDALAATSERSPQRDDDDDDSDSADDTDDESSDVDERSAASDLDESKSDDESGDAPDEEEFDVERVVSKQESRRGVQYLVKWVGHEKPSWEPAAYLKGAPDAVAEYEKQRRGVNPTALPPSPVKRRVTRASAQSATVDTDAVDDGDDESDGVFFPAAMSVLQALGGCSRL